MSISIRGVRIGIGLGSGRIERRSGIRRELILIRGRSYQSSKRDGVPVPRASRGRGAYTRLPYTGSRFRGL